MRYRRRRFETSSLISAVTYGFFRGEEVKVTGGARVTKVLLTALDIAVVKKSTGFAGSPVRRLVMKERALEE